MGERFKDVLDDGAVDVDELERGTTYHERGGRAMISIHADASTFVVISAKDARRLANALIEIAEANGA